MEEGEGVPPPEPLDEVISKLAADSEVPQAPATPISQLVKIDLSNYEYEWVGHGGHIELFTILYDTQNRRGIELSSHGIFVLEAEKIHGFEEYLKEGLPTKESYERSSSLGGVQHIKHEVLPADVTAQFMPLIEQYIKAQQSLDETVKPAQENLNAASEALTQLALQKFGIEKEEPYTPPKPPEVHFDPNAVDAVTRQRLEEIIIRADNNSTKAQFYELFGNEERAAIYRTAEFLWQVGYYLGIYSNTPPGERQRRPEAKTLLVLLKNAEEYGTPDAIKNGVRTMIYEQAVRQDEQELAHDIGKLLKLPESVLLKHKEARLYNALIGKYYEHRSHNPTQSEDDRTKELAAGIAPDKVKEIALKAYHTSLAESNNSFHRYEKFFSAAKIAKHMGLGNDLVFSAVKSAIEFCAEQHQKEPNTILSGEQKTIEGYLQELSIPRSLASVLGPAYFKYALHNPAKAMQIAAGYNLAPEQINSVVEKEHNWNIQCGSFVRALAIREAWPALFEKAPVSLPDLKLLVQIQYAKNAERGMPPQPPSGGEE